jgi:serine/threonine protein kinase
LEQNVSLAGQTIGNYKVVQQIGEGGMGVVYMAEHPVIGRKVAIKLLHASYSKDSETVARFFNEARAIHMIAHPNIVEILDFGQTNDGQPYFIMELLQGEPLADRISHGAVPPLEAVAIVSQICDALQAAHDKHIVHRDLKPHNVYLLGVAPKQHVKILDFGVAKMSSGWDTSQSGGKSVKTRTGSLMGTPLYMSPEQCRGSGKLDHRTDIYSLAVILFEMISGRPPFIAEGVGELFAKHMLEPAPSLSEFAPRTPPHIVRAVARALAKELDERYPNMNAFRDALSGQADPLSGDLPRPRRAAAQPTTLSTQHPQHSMTAELPPEQTTLSSAVSELDSDLDGLPVKSRKRLIIGMTLALGVAVAAFAVMRKKPAPPPPVVAVAPTPAAPNAPTEPPEPQVVSVKFEAEPPSTHVFKKGDGDSRVEDLGPVPVELKLPRSGDDTAFLLRAEGHRERTINVDLSRDQVLHVSLERLPPQAAKAAKAPGPARPAKPKKPVIHDADGLAVPSF